ncbi:hypothetical protein ACFQ4Y_07615, partial [Kroppenstedtia sanguinis]
MDVIIRPITNRPINVPIIKIPVTWYYPHTAVQCFCPSGKMDKSTELPEGIFLWRKKGKHSNGTHWKPKRKRSAFIW